MDKTAKDLRIIIFIFELFWLCLKSPIMDIIKQYNADSVPPMTNTPIKGDPPLPPPIPTPTPQAKPKAAIAKKSNAKIECLIIHDFVAYHLLTFFIIF